MVTQRTSRATPVSFPNSFGEWREVVIRSGQMPIVTIVGSRGKTTVARVLEQVLASEGLRVATWTSLGVEIGGRRQRGELGPWSNVLAGLRLGRLDVAIQEIDWSTAATTPVATEGGLLVVTNVCANRESCLIQGEARLAARTLPRLLESLPATTVAVMNGEDYAVSGDEIDANHPRILAGHGVDAPLMSRQRDLGGAVVYAADGVLALKQGDLHHAYCHEDSLAFALGGASSFGVLNALLAAGAASAMGIPAARVGQALADLTIDPLRIPGAFNVFHFDGITAIVDRPTPSWFIRPILRAVRPRGDGRVLIVAGPMQDVPDEDMVELGRLLGRSSGALLLQDGEEPEARREALRGGIALNDVPPVIVNLPTERRAVRRALDMARPGDTVLVLTGHPVATVRSLHRREQAASSAAVVSKGHHALLGTG